MTQIPAAHRRLIRRRVLNSLLALTPPKVMGKKKPKKPKSPATKSASKPSPVKQSVSDSDPPSSEADSEVHSEPPVEVEAHSPLVDSDLVPPSVLPPSDVTEIVDLSTDPSLASIEPGRPPLSQTDKTVIAVASADPSSAQLVTPPNDSELSSAVPPVCSSDLPNVALQLIDSPLLDSQNQAPNVEAETKASSAEVVEIEQPSERLLVQETAVAKANEEVVGAKETIDSTTSDIVVRETTDSVVGVIAVVESTPPATATVSISNLPPVLPIDPSGRTADTWCNKAKGVGKKLSKKGEAFTLPSGETCIQIPNAVIEKHRKSWEPFVIGQFYSDPPSQGTLHNIVNGIWSKQYRDIAVSKMEGFSFLFRIPNAATRNRVLKQQFWQIEGQTMFVGKWEPGIVPEKPELTSAPIWLELRKVPLQFFNEDGLERIAGLVGHPEYLHPMTANKTNLEVAKVFTIIDPRKPLPEAVNVQFESGEICRVLVSCPWMPPVCEICKEVGHISKRCPQQPKVCSICKSTLHIASKCPKKPQQEPRGRKTRRSKSRSKQQWVAVDPSSGQDKPPQEQVQQQRPVETEQSHETSIKTKPAAGTLVVSTQTKLGTRKDQALGESSGTKATLSTSGQQLKHPVALQSSGSGSTRASLSDVQPDSSDVESSDSELEEGEFSMHEPDFEVVRPRKAFSGRKGKRGTGPIIN